LSTVSTNRIAVISASIFWSLIFNYDYLLGGTLQPEMFGIPTASIFKGTMFVSILILGILEGLSASGNMLSMERDWIVAVAASDGKPYDLTHLNSTMRRIDLICKLLAPILISVVVSATNVGVGVLVVGAMSLLSWGIEICCARRVWTLNAQLKEPRIVNGEQESVGTAPTEPSPAGMRNKIVRGLQKYAQDFHNYFSTNVWIPSLALAFLHLSALTYSATFITYLLSVGFSLDLITIARAAGSVVEISSTVVTPVGVRYLGRAVNHGRRNEEQTASDESTMALLEEGAPDVEGRTETGLERLGLWGISWQLLNLVSLLPSISVLV
jgi:iron-regulated transporter 1